MFLLKLEINGHRPAKKKIHSFAVHVSGTGEATLRNHSHIVSVCMFEAWLSKKNTLKKRPRGRGVRSADIAIHQSILNRLYLYKPFRKVWNTNFAGGTLWSFGRGNEGSFRAEVVSTSHFKADATIAFLSLFPRSRSTLMRENVLRK